MNRRNTLNTLIGRADKSTTVLPPPSAGLEPYAGNWGFSQAAHLLRRTTFGASKTEIEAFVDAGLELSIQSLFTERALPDPPVNYNYSEDPNVAIGATWVNAPYILNPHVLNYRNRSLRAWQVKTMLEEPISIREKLTLFWHNHFAVSNIADPKFLYKHITLLRDNAWGNFKDLVKAIIIDPAMLRFLNGNQNTKESPNENFARELLELFTIGKGPLAGPGDYTTYTEADVRAISRALTGWRDIGYFSLLEEVEIGAVYRPFRHDTSQKQLSQRFGNAVIDNGNDTEYQQVVDLIFQQPAVAHFIARKLYRWFVYYQIDEQTEANVIQPMANLLIQQNYEIRPALEALLKSQHFYDMLNIGPMIKNPYDFSIGLFRQNKLPLPTEEKALYDICLVLFGYINLMEMEYFAPPSVAGWKAYYQEPAFYRIWINSSTLRPRMAMTDVFATVGFRLPNTPNLQIDVFKLLEQISLPQDPNVLIQELTELYFPLPISQTQINNLKEVLIPGLPDFEWTVEYNLYLDNPEDQATKGAVEIKLRTLLRTILNMPEFYLS